jgi:hypothetical protein
MNDESEEGALAVSDLIRSDTGISEKQTMEEEKETRSPDDEEAMESETPQDDFDENPDGKKVITTSLLWKSRGYTYEFAHSPVKHCAWILLALRAVERGINFGLTFLNPYFLTGAYYDSLLPRK